MQRLLMAFTLALGAATAFTRVAQVPLPLHIYWVPVESVVRSGPGPAQTRTAAQPKYLAEARVCGGPGSSRWAKVTRNQTTQPFALLIIEAVTCPTIDAAPDAIKIGTGATMTDVLDADLTARALSAEMQTRLAQMGLSTASPVTRRQLVQRLRPGSDEARFESFDRSGRAPLAHQHVSTLVRASLAAFPWRRLTTDDFNRSTGELGANWTDVGGGSNNIDIVSSNCSTNNCAGPNGFNSIAAYVGTFPDDHYAQVELRFIATEGDTGILAVRLGDIGGTSAVEGYGAYLSDTETNMCEFVDGTCGYVCDGTLYTPVTTTYYTFKLSVTGTGLTSTIDGGTAKNCSDATVTSGKPGMSMNNNGSGIRMDDFEATDASASSCPVCAAVNVLLRGGGVWR